ncbi:hypothetical protein PWT90_04493 [Aphanocladium album]|nr:hypothetical protein PWT90_04493 [Aphanocladium album]
MPQPSRPWRALQPLKALYIAYFFLSTPPYLVYSLLKLSLLKRLRESPRLSLKANVGNPLVRALFSLLTITRSPRLLANNLPRDKTRVTSVAVPSASLFTGVLTSNASIKPAPQRALWFPKAPPAGADLASETVVLHFPGGGFVMEVGHAGFGTNAAQAVLGSGKTARFVWAQYRLASTPGCGFPAAIQDAVTYYAYILSLGYDPKNVVLSGDSAGGNVVLALLRYLHETRVLPLPRGVFAWSPWVEVTPQAARDFTETNQAATDILTGSFLQWGSDSYRPKGRLSDEVAAYVSPLHRPYSTEVPVFIHAGEAEGFCPSVRKFAEQMEEVNGNDKIRFHGTPNAVHDLILVWETQGMRKEIDAALSDAWETVGA